MLNLTNENKVMDYEKKYKEALERAKKLKETCDSTAVVGWCEYIFPELKESEDERIRRALMKFIEKIPYERLENDGVSVKEALAWLEKQGNEPNWCHHQIGVTKVDLSGCSEEYRKAYYDGWNNCNQQHSQCKSDWNDVVKCLINGMKFYYEDNEEATWGTEKFSMKVKDILSWLEKQGESYTKRDVDDAYVEGMAFAKNELEKQGKQEPAWSEEDEKEYKYVLKFVDNILNNCGNKKDYERCKRCYDWLKSLRPQNTWKPSDEQMVVLELASKYERVFTSKQIDILIDLKNQLKKLKGE